jgi:hypothetical protein
MLRQMNHRERLLDWLNKEKQKDQTELMREKEKFTQQITQMKKTDLFQKPKNSIWKRIQKLLWGN